MAVVVSKEERREVKAYYDALTEHIKTMRKERKISQLKLANILGHNSTSFIARIELRQNNANYNLAHLVMLAQEWDLDIKEMIPSLEDVKKHRELRGITQLQLSLALNLKSPGLISQSELYIKKQHFNIKHLYQIAYILECDITDFFIES